MKKDAVDEDFSKSNIGSHFEKMGWLIFISAAIIIGLYAYTFSNLPMNEDPSRWGTFGDFVGGLLNPLVSTCTFIVAVRVFQLQKIETKMTRDALEGSEQAMQEQARIAEQQRSEQRFFDLLNIYKITLDNQNYSSMNDSGDSSTWNNFIGKEAIYRIYSDASRLIESIGDLFALKSKITIDGILLFTDLQDEDDPRMLLDRTNAYSRSVLMIVKTISEDASINKKYLELFISQLTQAELSMIAIYILLDSDGASYVDIANSSGLFLRMKEGVLLEVLNNYFLKDSSSREDVDAN